MNNNVKNDKLDIQNIFLETEAPTTTRDSCGNKNEDVPETFAKNSKTVSNKKGSKIQTSSNKKSGGRKNDKTISEPQKKSNLRSYYVSEELLTAQKEILKFFNHFDIKEPNIKDDYVDMCVMLPEKPNFFQRMCLCASKPTLRRWFIDSDNFSLSGDTYKSFSTKQIKEIDDRSIRKKIYSVFKKAPKLQNMLIRFHTLFTFDEEMKLISKILTNSQLNEIKQLRFSILPHPEILWSLPRFLFDHFIFPDYNLVPKLNPHFELQNYFQKYIDKGPSTIKTAELLEKFLLKFEKNYDLQVLHLKLSSWLQFGDDILNIVCEIIWKIGFNLRELDLFLCGKGLTDFGIEHLCKTILEIKNKKLIALSLGFDVRTRNITDHGLQKIAETILSLSEFCYLKSISLCFISENISDFGLWCLGQAIHKIAHRLNNLVLMFGATNLVTDKGVIDLLDPILRKVKDMKALSLGFFAYQLNYYATDVIQNLVEDLESLESFNFMYSNKGSRNSKREEEMKFKIARKGKVKKMDIVIYLE